MHTLGYRITVLVTSLVLVLWQNFKSPEKVLERKVEHRYVVSDPQFRREMSVLLGPTIVRGNKVTALQNGNEIFPAMLLAIRSAKMSITFETYIYWSGQIGEEFSQALSERARAGVPVKVIIDWVGSTKMDQSLLDSMQAAGVQMHRYRPLRLSLIPLPAGRAVRCAKSLPRRFCYQSDRSFDSGLGQSAVRRCRMKRLETSSDTNITRNTLTRMPMRSGSMMRPRLPILWIVALR